MKKRFIQICGVEYSIEEINFVADGAAMGRSNSQSGEILLSKDLPDSIKRATLLHEIIHQISDRLGIDLTETQVRSLESGLVPFFKFDI